MKTMYVFTPEEVLEIVRERMSESDVNQKNISEVLDLSKYDVSKIFHGKRKLYLFEFITIAFHIGLIDPNFATFQVEHHNIESITREDFDKYLKTQLFNMQLVPKFTISSKEKEIENLKKKVERLEGIIQAQKQNGQTITCDIGQLERMERLEKENKTLRDCLNPDLSMDDINDACDETRNFIKDSGGDFRDAFYELMARIKKAITEERSQFSLKSFLEYQRLKKNQYFLENQYVFNLDDLREK